MKKVKSIIRWRNYAIMLNEAGDSWGKYEFRHKDGAGERIHFYSERARAVEAFCLSLQEDGVKKERLSIKKFLAEKDKLDAKNWRKK